MAITVGDKVYRNLPEQVEENANNIQWLLTTIQSFGNVMRYCGSVATYADLPTEDLRTGDVYNVLDTGNNYAWDGEAWDEISSIVDLTGYVTKIGCPLPYYEIQFTTDLNDFLIANPEANGKLISLKTTDANPDNPLLTLIVKEPTQLRFEIWNVYAGEHHSGYVTDPATITLGQAMDGTYEVIYVQNYEIEHMANKWVGAYVGDETAFTTNMAVGDVLIESTGGNFLINEITFTGTTLTKVVLVGLEDNGNPIVHTFENNAWTSSNYVDTNFLDLTSAQTISGIKYFQDNFRTNQISASNGQSKIEITTGVIVFNNIIRAKDNGSRDIGTNSIRWKDLYLNGNALIGGNITDGTNSVTVAGITKKPSTSYSLTDGGTITDSALKTLIQNEQPIKLNGFTCYFSCDDGTNYQYVSTRYDAVANKNHINVITINKSTWVATFHTSDLALS